MKTKTLTVAILVLTLVSGVRTSGQIFSFGVKAGVGYSWYSNSDKGGSGSRALPNTMFQGGMAGTIRFTKVGSLQFELLFQQNGEKYKMAYSSVEGIQAPAGRLSMNYLVVPVLVKFFHESGKFFFSGGLGPYAAYALNGRVVTGGRRENMHFGDDKFRRYDLGTVVDLGAGVKAGKGRIFIDLRYTFGLTDVQQNNCNPEGFIPHSNRNLGISLGYVIPTGKSR